MNEQRETVWRYHKAVVICPTGLQRGTLYSMRE